MLLLSSLAQRKTLCFLVQVRYTPVHCYEAGHYAHCSVSFQQLLHLTTLCYVTMNVYTQIYVFKYTANVVFVMANNGFLLLLL